MGPFGNEVARSTAGVKGVRKFLDKVVKLSSLVIIHEAKQSAISHDNKHYKKSLSLLYKTIKKVTEDIDNFSFNTAISALMIYINHLEESYSEDLPQELLESFIQLLAPFAPHLAEELREKL